MMKHAAIGMVSLLLLSACSSTPQHASFSNAASSSFAAADSCSALGYAPGTTEYSQCQENLRVRTLIAAHKALGGNNQPDGLMAQTYDRRMGLSINCTSYQMHIAGAPTLCD